MMNFSDKIAIVTGAGRGIGAAIAHMLASRGARVTVLDTDGEAAAHTCTAISEVGGQAMAQPGDVTSAASVAAAVSSTADQWGGIDILVNNAGIIRDNFVESITEQDWDAVMSVNLKGAFLCSRAAIPHMKERGAGRIVNIGSRAWLGNRGQANYSASKAGLVGLTRTLALELAPSQITVNVVAPGLVDTDMTRGLPDKVRERLLRMQPSGKMGTVDDVAAAVCFLSGADAGYITGQVLTVDGGKSVGSSTV